MEKNNYVFDMLIEIPYNSFIKYEYDKELNKMRCDRVLSTSMGYPGNYGYIPNTISGDNDPIDVLMISDYMIHPGTIIIDLIYFCILAYKLLFLVVFILNCILL